MPNAFIRKLTAHGTLSNEDVRLLSEATRFSRSVNSRRDLIREGDEPGSLFIILRGWACRYKSLPDGSRQITSFLIPGDFCDPHGGELAAMDHSIATLTDCEIRTLPRIEAEKLLVATPTLTKAFWRSQLIEESVLRNTIVNIGRRNSIQRVAHLMIELYMRMKIVGLVHEDGCEMPMTQIVISDAVSLTPVHLNRVLRHLRDKRVIELKSNTLRIFDLDGLVDIAGFDGGYLHPRPIKAV